MQLDFDAMFAAHVASTQKEWAHDRTETVGASEIFGCLRKAFFRKRGAEFFDTVPDGFEVVEDSADPTGFSEQPKFAKVFHYPKDDDFEDRWGASRRGDLLEAHYVVPAVRDNLPGKAKMLFSGSDQKTLFHKRNSATPDGLIIGLDRDALAKYGVPDIGTHCICLEIKSIDPRVNLKEERAIHHGQAQTQMGIFRETTPYQPNYTVLLYVDASFLDHIRVFVVPYERQAWTSAQIRATTLYEVKHPSEIPPEGKLDGECEYCEFTRSCAFVTTGAIPEDESKITNNDELLLSEFDAIAEDYEATKNRVDAAAKDLEVLRQRIKDELTRIGTRKIGGKKAKRHWSIAWYGQNGQRRLDSKLLTDALGDLEPFKTEGNPFDVLRVTFSDEKG